MKSITLSASLIYMWVLYWLSSLPGTGTSENLLSTVPSFFQNMLHLPAYGLLVLLWIATFKARRYQDSRAIWLSASLATAYGAGLELYQAYVPGRFPSWTDLILNLMGILLFSAGYRFFKPYLLIFRMGV